MAAARWWYSGERAKTVQEYLAEGYPLKVAAFMAEQPPPVCEVWPENWPCLRVFLAMDTQWRPNFSGMDYAALPTVWEALAIAPEARGALFADLQHMESAAMTAAMEAKT